MTIGGNLKLLRKRLGKSQEEVANDLNLTRSSYSGYENNVAQPSLEGLILISDYFKISIDELVRKDLSAFKDKDWKRLESGVAVDASGIRLRVLTSQVNEKNEDLIELIPQKASAGYSSGYADPDYLKVLPTFHLPFLSRDRKYRSFPIKGDSMPPVLEGSYVIGEYVQNWMSIRNGTPCIVVTKDDGIVFKVLHNLLQSEQSFQLSSTNPFYEPYNVHVNTVLEIWKFVNYISSELPDVRMDDKELAKSIQLLQKEVRDLKTIVNN